MPLEVLVLVVAVGGVLLGLELWLTGSLRDTTLRDPEHATRRFNRDYPYSKVLDVTLSDDARAALLQTDNDTPPGLVFALGDRTVTRQLGPHTSVQPTPEGLRLDLHDFTCPPVTLKLSDPQLRDRWIARLATP